MPENPTSTAASEKSPTSPARDDKKARLSKALRANLQRRKSAASAREDDSCPSS